MKQFFSLTYFKELKVLLILELLMLLDLTFLLYFNEVKLDLLFNLPALLITLSIWGLSSLIDKEKYFNLATLIATGFITYLVFWFMFNIMK